MTDLKKLEWVKPPRQNRSQQTMERILDSAEELILEKGLEKTTVSEIAKHAGSSVGAFYTRFADKGALLRCVFQRFSEEAHATVRSVVQPEQWKNEGLEVIIESLISFAVGIFETKRKLLATIKILSMNDPTIVSFGQQMGERMTDGLCTLLHYREDKLIYPRPDYGVRFLVFMFLNVLESRVLLPAESNFSNEEIIAEFKEIAVRYLGISTNYSQNGGC